MIKHLLLKVSSRHVVDFYTDIMGFQLISQKSHVYYLKANKHPQQCTLVLEITKTSKTTAVDNMGFWKIGLTLPHLDRAIEALKKQNVDVSQARQFVDVGYLCHIQDPDGNTIELLQNSFEGEMPSNINYTNYGLSQDIALAHISLRVTSAEKSVEFYSNTLGLNLITKIEVEPYAFTLYFFAYTDDVPPSKDLNAVVNRPWLYKRPYTIIELRHDWERQNDECYYYPTLHTRQLGFSSIRLDKRELPNSISDPDGCWYISGPISA